MCLSRCLTAILLFWIAGAQSLPTCADADIYEPIADVHLHYYLNQQALVDADDAVSQLVEQNVVFGVVSSTPPDLALLLRRAAGKWIIPIFMPYLEPDKRHSWFNDDRVLKATQEALASGEYFGIGEIHLTAGLAPNPRKRHPIVDGLLGLAVAYDVPIMIHTEASDYRYFLPLCQRHPAARIQWAHAGGLLPPEQVGMLLEACPNVWVDLAARDNDRYINSPVVSANGRLLPGWRAVIEKYPDRFLIGSDPIWPVVDRGRWDSPNVGWERLGDFLDFHRRWLYPLPDRLSRKLRLENAQRLYRIGTKPGIEWRRY
jgi:hypothetical protein